ncbi:MAG: response regulator transcription factor [Gemmatimonadota bacterium]|nr:response regulator transcription factor [Gemmatimonadota bacterium]
MKSPNQTTASDKPAPAKILVVEDDGKTADLVALYMRHAGHKATVATSGARGLELATDGGFDLLILDVMLPGASGLEICEAVRRQAATPIILLTARTLEDQKIEGLDLGADDYVTKPFSPRELVARVHALLRRAPPGAGEVVRAGKIVLDLERRASEIAGQAIDLTPSEFEILLALANRPGRVLSRGQLLDRLPTRGETALDRTIDVHIRNLRRKLSVSPNGAEHIETVFGTGYRLRTDFR